MYRKHLKTLLLILITSISVYAQEETQKLKVGYAGSPPFVMHTEPEEGIVIDIWKQIAFGLNEQYQFVEFKTVESGVNAVQNNEVDILIGPITINSERAARATFSQPYYNTELAILAPVVETTFWSRIKPFLSSTFIYAVIGLLIILSIVGFLFWLVEGRKSEEDYGKGVVKGIGSGVWLAVVTMTTVGYGDYAPRTPGGRIIMGAWMIISLILATSFVAGIATTFSQSNTEDMTITGLNHLEDKRVAVPNYKKIIDKVLDSDGTPVPVADISEGYKLLLDKKVDALIYDQVPLAYTFEDKRRKEFVLSTKKILPQYYGFLFPENSDLKARVDLQIINLRESQGIIHIVEDWISRN